MAPAQSRPVVFWALFEAVRHDDDVERSGLRTGTGVPDERVTSNAEARLAAGIGVTEAYAAKR